MSDNDDLFDPSKLPGGTGSSSLKRFNESIPFDKADNVKWLLEHFGDNRAQVSSYLGYSSGALVEAMKNNSISFRMERAAEFARKTITYENQNIDDLYFVVAPPKAVKALKPWLEEGGGSIRKVKLSPYN